MPKLLHIADLHLDSRFVNFSPSQSSDRRNLQRQVFSRALSFAENASCDVVLICGDLFDSELCTENTLLFLSECFSRHPEIKFVISPGNHDPYSSDSPYRAADFPDNVFIFNDKKVSSFVFPELDLTVYGYAFTSPAYYDMPLESADLSGKKTHYSVLCAHTELDVPLSRYAPVTTAQLAASDLDYAALGHIHAGSGIHKAGKTLFAYSGCVEGRDFSECGEKGGILVSLSENGTHAEKVYFSQRIYAEADLDISSLESEDSIIQAAKKKFADIKKDPSKDYIIRLKLCGTVSGEPDTAVIYSQLAEYGAAEVVDETVCLYKSLDFDKDFSIRGQFYRQLLPLLLSEKPEERSKAKAALKFGLCALDGKEL